MWRWFLQAHLVRECDIMAFEMTESDEGIGDGQSKIAGFHGRKFA